MKAPKKKATAPKTKKSTTSKKKGRAAARSDELGGWVVVSSSKKRAEPRHADQAAKTKSVDAITSKFGRDSVREGGGGRGATLGHGKIVRIRPTRKYRDPADEIGDKAVYLDPQGHVEFRQG